MTEIPHHLTAVLERLPVAVGLVSATGHFLGKSGGMASMFGRMVPSHNKREARRWSFTDRFGAAIPPSEWPSGRALRGERHYDGMVGAFHDGDTRVIKVISMPVVSAGGPVAAVTFLQVLDAHSRSADGSHYDIQQRLIDELARAVSAGWQEQAG